MSSSSAFQAKRVRKHARRIWSVGEGEALRSWWKVPLSGHFGTRTLRHRCRSVLMPKCPYTKVPTGTGSAGIDRTNGIRQILRRVATKDRVHDTAQLELDPPADRKPVQLQKACSNMFLRPEFEHQASGCVLHSLQWCDRCLRQAGQR